MHSTVLSTVFLLYFLLFKRLARLWWLLPLATHKQTHGSPSVAFPPVACEPLNSRYSHVPRQRPQRLLPWRRPLIRPSPQHARLLLPMQPRQCLKPRRNSLCPVAPRCHRTRRSRLHLSRFPRLNYLEFPAKKLPRADLPRAEPRAVELAQPPGGPPGDPDDDPDKKKRDREIDLKRKGQFLIDSTALRSAKGRSGGNMKFEVERFERGTDLTIKDWINQMETYFTIGQVPPEAYVGFMLMKIVPRHLNKIKQYHSLDYLSFWEKVVEVFEVPDLATAYLNALASFCQTRDESISDYMQRARLLVIKAHPDLAYAPRERILITSFLLGQYDRHLASSLAVVKIQTAADAERLAAEGEAVRRDQRPRRSTSNFLPEGARAPESDDPDEPSDAESLEEEEEELRAGLGTTNHRQAFNSIGKPPERRKATSIMRCYKCGQYGHFKSECSRPNRQSPDASLQGLSSNVCSAKVTTLYVIVHHCLQLSKRLHAQDKFE